LYITYNKEYQPFRNNNSLQNIDLNNLDDFYIGELTNLFSGFETYKNDQPKKNIFINTPNIFKINLKNLSTQLIDLF